MPSERNGMNGTNGVNGTDGTRRQSDRTPSPERQGLGRPSSSGNRGGVGDFGILAHQIAAHDVETRSSAMRTVYEDTQARLERLEQQDPAALESIRQRSQEQEAARLAGQAPSMEQILRDTEARRQRARERALQLHNVSRQESGGSASNGDRPDQNGNMTNGI